MPEIATPVSCLIKLREQRKQQRGDRAGAIIAILVGRAQDVADAPASVPALIEKRAQTGRHPIRAPAVSTDVNVYLRGGGAEGDRSDAAAS